MAKQNEAIRYAVTDSHTGRLIATYGTASRAYRRADDLDNAYGAVRFVVSAATAPRVAGQAEERARSLNNINPSN